MISAGLEGEAVMTGEDNLSYGWVEENRMWRYFGNEKVKNIESGGNGRLFKVGKNSMKLFQQSKSPDTEDCLKKVEFPMQEESLDTE